MRHLAATPVGMTVRAKAVLRETDGRRCLFDVEAWDEVEKIAEGRHERYVVSNLARFLERTTAKDRARPGRARKRCPAREPRSAAARGNRASPPPWRERPDPPTGPPRG